jgi:UPF0042 nucleotide-binding protein
MSDDPAMSGNGAAPLETNLVDLVIISGQSGAGKSSAMNVFEDAGYFCVDNLPAEMIRSLAGLFVHEGSKVERAAVVCDLRGGQYFEHLARVIETLRSDGVTHRLIFLCANDETLLSRYKETRRRHPLAPEGNVIDGIRREAEALAPIRELADTLIDTSALSASALRRKVANEMLEEKSPRRLAVTFGSFGHKHGPPRDADLAFDVRFLPNPHWEPELRDRVVPLLEYLLPQYVAEGKAHLVVAIGCTGGRHRSVAIAEHLASHFRSDDRYFIEVQHRDVDRAPTRA